MMAERVLTDSLSSMGDAGQIMAPVTGLDELVAVVVVVVVVVDYACLYV